MTQQPAIASLTVLCLEKLLERSSNQALAALVAACPTVPRARLLAVVFKQLRALTEPHCHHRLGEWEQRFQTTPPSPSDMGRLAFVCRQNSTAKPARCGPGVTTLSDRMVERYGILCGGWGSCDYADIRL